MGETFRKISRRFWLICNILVVFWVLIGVYCLNVPPYEFWPAGFVALSMPGALLLNLFFLVLWLLKRSWLAVLSLMVLVLGWNYYGRQFAVNLARKEEPPHAKTLEVLSFNVHLFRKYSGQGKSATEATLDMVNWVATHPADIFCLQEFYNDPNSDIYNSISRIGTRYERHLAFSVANPNKSKREGGIAIFSKYPIINEGTITFNKSTHNRVAWADIVITGDTVRVYATHLQSMNIKKEDIENTYSSIGNQGEMEREGRNLARRLRFGFVTRGHQVETLKDHFDRSPYPFIVCGDFNDIPFSYTYNVMSEGLHNAFETAGVGLGATYNGPIPFLRIDNQFYSDRLRAYEFRVHQEMGLSDHLPIAAKYVLEPRTGENPESESN